MITIIDYGLGNIESIANMLKKIGQKSIISQNNEDILEAKKLILPGVGSFDTGMNNLKKRGFIEILNKRVLKDKIPILGICLGMQLMSKSSEEGLEKGFGWINAETKKFNYKSLKIPHMGWNSINIQKQSSLFNNHNQKRRFYFVHSYYVECNVKEDILTTTEYGQSFTSMFEKGNIYGAQFHPEKSHAFGMEIFNKFSVL